MATGYYHSAAVDESEPQWVLDGVMSAAAGTGHSLALDADGNVWSWGANESSQLGDGNSEDGYSPALMVFFDN